MLEKKFEYVADVKDKYSIFMEDEPTLIEFLAKNTRPDQVIYVPRYGYNQHLIDGKKVVGLSFFRGLSNDSRAQ
jgi:hypothetical protein